MRPITISNLIRGRVEMRHRVLAIFATAVSVSGCYHITVLTGAPESPTRIEEPWQMSFVSGLVPPSEIQADEECTEGVAKVETRRRFMNVFVAALSSSIVTPITVIVTCAVGSPGPGDATASESGEPPSAGSQRGIPLRTVAADRTRSGTGP